MISDYPSPELLKNIERNATKNIAGGLKSTYRVAGHEWGVLDSEFAQKYKHYFTRILAADCYWMPWVHTSLARSMLHLLAPDGTIYMTAGFHTGRAKLAGFFDVAVEEGLVVEEIYEEDNLGTRREWLKERDGGVEDRGERRKWLVVARLKRRQSGQP